jgi:hypothetical protein
MRLNMQQEVAQGSISSFPDFRKKQSVNELGHGNAARARDNRPKAPGSSIREAGANSRKGRKVMSVLTICRRADKARQKLEDRRSEASRPFDYRGGVGVGTEGIIDHKVALLAIAVKADHESCLDMVIPELEGAGITRDDIREAVRSGRFLGANPDFAERIVSHNCEDAGNVS